MGVFRFALFLLSFLFLSEFAGHTVAAERNESCIKTITIMENIFDAEKIKYADDKCSLLKAAAANRMAMLNEIGKDSQSCGLAPNTVDAMKLQYEKFTRMQISVCH